MNVAEVVKMLKSYKAGTLNRWGMGAMMKIQIDNLSDEEIKAVADYVSKL